MRKTRLWAQAAEAHIKAITSLNPDSCIFPYILLLLFSHQVTSGSLRPHGLQSARLLCPWDFPGKNIRADCHFLVQRLFLTQGSNLCLLHWQADSLLLSHQGSLPIDSKVQNSVTWDIWLSLIYNNLFKFRLPAFCCKTST